MIFHRLSVAPSFFIRYYQHRSFIKTEFLENHKAYLMINHILDHIKDHYPKSPFPTQLKAALLYAGVRYHHCLAVAGEWSLPNYLPYHLPNELPAYKGKRVIDIPYLLRLADDTQVRLRIRDNSPFIIETLDEDKRLFELRYHDQVITTLTFEPSHPWVNALTSDGTPLRSVGLTQHGDMLVMNIAPGCEYFYSPLGGQQNNLSCRFCLYGLPDKRMKDLGQELFKPLLPERSITQICDACSHTETHSRHLYLVGGSMTDMHKEGERYVQIARALGERGITDQYYVACGSGAIPRKAMEEIKKAGVKGACFNLEVWDPKQFKRICPGKDHYVGRDRWIAALEEAVDVFGEGNVMSAFVGGVELEGEGAFSSLEEAMDSNMAGADELMSKRIQPVYSLHWKVTGKERNVEPIYNLDHFMKLNENLFELRKKHNLYTNPEFFCRRCAYMQMEPDYDYWAKISD